jgi:uncharacterized membrane protein
MPRPRSLLARASIWTIVNHDFLARQIRYYIWGVSATIFLLFLASIIPIHIALFALIFFGFGTMLLLWALIHWRKAILLDIRDEKLRRSAHAAMLALIHARQKGKHILDNPHESHPRWFGRKSHS